MPESISLSGDWAEAAPGVRVRLRDAPNEEDMQFWDTPPGGVVVLEVERVSRVKAEFIAGLAGTIVSNAKAQVEKSWGEHAETRLGRGLYAGVVSEHVLLALVGYLNARHGSGLTDAEARVLVPAVWEEFRRG